MWNDLLTGNFSSEVIEGDFESCQQRLERNWLTAAEASIRLACLCRERSLASGSKQPTWPEIIAGYQSKGETRWSLKDRMIREKRKTNLARMYNSFFLDETIPTKGNGFTYDVYKLYVNSVLSITKNYEIIWKIIFYCIHVVKNDIY